MFDRIKEDVACVFDRDPAARNTFEILTNYPGVHALLLHRMIHKLWLQDWKWTARSFASFSRWFTGIEIHPGAQIGRRFFIDHGMGVVIGETAVVGDDCTLYHGVTLGGTSWQKGQRHPTLANNVVVGAGAKVLGPIKISSGARIGSNAVVLKPVPENATVVGVPGRLIERKTDPKHQQRLKTAKKIGFDAYGTPQDMPDPVAHAINCMLDHIHHMDTKMHKMCEQLHILGAEIHEDDKDWINLPECELHIDAKDPQKQRMEE